MTGSNQHSEFDKLHAALASDRYEWDSPVRLALSRIEEQVEAERKLRQETAGLLILAREKAERAEEQFDAVRTTLADAAKYIPYCVCLEGADGNPCSVCGKPESVSSPASDPRDQVETFEDGSPLIVGPNHLASNPTKEPS